MITLPPPIAEAKPRLKAGFAENEILFGSCSYSGPCAIGFLMTDTQKEALAAINCDAASISRLFDEGLVGTAAPGEQDWYERLQKAVDDNNFRKFKELTK